MVVSVIASVVVSAVIVSVVASVAALSAAAVTDAMYDRGACSVRRNTEEAIADGPAGDGNKSYSMGGHGGGRGVDIGCQGG